MESHLLMNDIMKDSKSGAPLRTLDCPDEAWYWDFMDDRVTAEGALAHAQSCPFCRHELIQVGRAMLNVNESEGGAERLHMPTISSALPDVRLVLKAVGHSIFELFNPLQVIPAYRADVAGPLVILAETKLAVFKIELQLTKSSNFSIVAVMEKVRVRAEITVELSDNTGILRSLGMVAGDRKGLGEWPKGVYRLAIKTNSKGQHVMELELK